MKPEIYHTSFCNHGHRLKDGVPVRHECYVLPPAALEAERRDDFEEAQRILSAYKTRRLHKGVRS